MPTTFTSLLGLSLPATGELAGTWGDTVNNGITSLLDDAIAGTTTLSTDANVTLTTTTGAANQARQAILLCTGARTAQRTITAPAASKTYVVINATTGGFAVQLVGAGPTPGITAVSGERALVAWNGSDFVKIASNLVTGTATRIPFFDASGLLSSAADFVRDASGNVGIGVSNPGAFARFVVWGGSGSVQVQSTAVSPGVGARLILSDSNNSVFVESVMVGSASDMAFRTSSIERMRIDASGNVGIGTASPGQRLDVDGAIRTRAASFAEYYFGAANNGAISYDITANSMRFFVNSSERMRIDSSGNVGIGRGASGGLRLDVAGGGRVAELILENAGSAGTLGTSPGLYSPASGQLAISTNAAERMRIDSSGNVGIGTATPGARLDVNGAIRVSVGANSLQMTDPGDLTLNASNASGQIAARVGGAERLRIDSNGHQINTPGNTTPPTLTVNGQWNLTPTSNTNMRISYRGTDGVTRVANITLA